MIVVGMRVASPALGKNAPIGPGEQVRRDRGATSEWAVHARAIVQWLARTGHLATAVVAAGLMLAGCGTCDGAVTHDNGGCRPARPERIAPYSLASAVHNLIDYPGHLQPDTDGDGRADAIYQGGDGALVLTRGDGDLRLVDPRPGIYIQAWADFDGDGRDDLVVGVSLPAGPPAIYLVNGRTPPGTHPLAAVGARIDDDLNTVSYQDLDGRPGVDLLALVGDPRFPDTDVYSGAQLLGRGPGADARGTPPVRRLVGTVAGVAPLSKGAQPETLLFVHGPHPAVRFASRPAAVLQSPFDPAHRIAQLLVFDEGGARKIGLQVDDRVAIWPAPPSCPA
jgi:hypothetical protein